MTVPVSELTGVALDWAVATAEGLFTGKDGGVYTMPLRAGGYGTVWITTERRYSPSADWNLAGPIIERERIGIKPSLVAHHWYASIQNGESTLDSIHISGNSPLIAAMRCYVARKLGQTVQVPAELIA